MRILMTNNTLDERAGTELYVRDVAARLLALGHAPLCFSFQLGEVADELRALGVPVTATLSPSLGPFDVIHGHHRMETTLAAMTFPHIPVISYCHGPRAWQESPCTMPNVVRHVAVDESCRARLMHEGIDESCIEVLLNFADTDRFKLRSPLPDIPRRALVFSNTGGKGDHLKVVEAACFRHGIELDVVGRTSAASIAKPENLLPEYDLVFAKARSAIEAMAVGCAVIQCDYFGAGQLVTSANFDQLRPLNFGWKSMQSPITVEHLSVQISGYDAADATKVSQRIRTEASLDSFMPKLLALYERAVAQPLPDFDPWQEGWQFLTRQIASAKDGAALESLAAASDGLMAANDALNEANRRLIEENRSYIEAIGKLEAEMAAERLRANH